MNRKSKDIYFSGATRISAVFKKKKKRTAKQWN